MIRFFAGLLLVLSFGLPAAAEPLATRLFGAVTTPDPGPYDPIGSYSCGCAAGLVRMPESGPKWQTMRLSRDRNWGAAGHHRIPAGSEPLCRDAAGGEGIYIGDIGQPRGGPMASGHASHQIGLDADIWFLPPQSLQLTEARREKISAISVRTADQTRVNDNCTRSMADILEHAAKDTRVNRIFVAVAIKIAMCNVAPPSDASWLQKLRPWYWHIPPLLQNPKFLVRYEPEAVRHLAAEGFPLVRDGFAEELEDRTRELLLRRIVAIMGH